MNKLVRCSVLAGIICVWVLVYSLDTTTWSNSAILWIQTIVPMIMTVTGFIVFFKWDKVVQSMTSDNKGE